jgi:septal ring factor EnvC (AmiA/AmiB activator)
MVLGVHELVECPSCGTEVATAVKCWTVSPMKQTEAGNVPEFRVGIFECPKCKSKFRSRVGLEAKPVEIANVRSLVERIKEIREGLVQTLTALREKMKTLETERSSLLVEIEQLKKVAESRANDLEVEVSQLRAELKSLKELLGSTEEVA